MVESSLEAPATTERARISIFSKGTLYVADRPDRTLADFFEEGMKITGDGNFLGTTNGQVPFQSLYLRAWSVSLFTFPIASNTS